MRVAIVHDWLVGMRGGERCLEVIAELFPQADIYTLFYDPAEITDSIRSHRIMESCLQRMPGARALYRHMLPLYAVGVRDLERKISRQRYDLLISISHCVAKNVNVPRETFHLCYCLTPMRYIWDQYERYFSGKSYEPLMRMIRPVLQRADVRGAAGVQHFIGISNFVRERIRTLYGREADVVYPPVRTDWIRPRAAGQAGEGFLTVNALVPYKNTKLIVEAFNRLRLPLTIVGRGPEEKELRSMAGETIRIIPSAGEQELARLYASSKALVFAAEEDFGMTPVESQAAGRPVVCYGRGGVLETVSAAGENQTGIYFSELSAVSLCQAVENFMVRQEEFTVDNCLKQAEKFSLKEFKAGFSAVLQSLGIEGGHGSSLVAND
jgi:glycosyltransferase involved in cell wall biosynthesis